MSQGQQSTQHSASSKNEWSAIGRESPGAKSDDWSDVNDPGERRKIQNKLAQRRFRDKIKEQKEETGREVENQRRAGRSYASPEPEALDTSQTLSGLPWGGISMKHIVETGKRKGSQQSPRDSSVSEGASRTGAVSSRLGLRLCWNIDNSLTDQFARAPPAWQYFRYFPCHYEGQSRR
ncbi:hypothetical protein EJ02DRAFT_443170 [Clathrospora elynae]|uniref:BZIP domain-containing protein n=1 Tax=Clathrospora elynae TaxID=706981 RepID=A0A6A5ST08_9PLEO|nr:hypothetical protein EJ02DRAFT_443170 [Clathrospora elynae]